MVSLMLYLGLDMTSSGWHHGSWRGPSDAPGSQARRRRPCSRVKALKCLICRGQRKQVGAALFSTSMCSQTEMVVNRQQWTWLVQAATNMNGDDSI